MKADLGLQHARMTLAAIDDRPRLDARSWTREVDPIAVIVPWAESSVRDGWLERCLGRISAARVMIAARSEVSDSVLARLARAGCEVERSDAPRGLRLRRAAERSVAGHGATPGASTLLFHHADTRLPERWPDLIRAALDSLHPWGAFRLGFESANARRRLRLVALGGNLRTRLFGLPYGDQSPFVTREAYELVGGHPPWPRLDDLELSRRLRRLARPRLARGRVHSSDRRYEALGTLRTVASNFCILARFASGVGAHELAREYSRMLEAR